MERAARNQRGLRRLLHDYWTALVQTAAGFSRRAEVPVLGNLKV